MNQNTVYVQTIIQTMAGKVIRDLRRGGERELRNMMGLCRNSFSYPYYRQFCRMVEDALHAPRSGENLLEQKECNAPLGIWLRPFPWECGSVGAFFGFHRGYAQVKSLEAEDVFLQKSIQQGCLVGVYEGDSTQSFKEEEQLYQKLIQARSGGFREIFLCDLWRDRDAVQKLLLHERTFPFYANN